MCRIFNGTSMVCREQCDDLNNLKINNNKQTRILRTTKFLWQTHNDHSIEIRTNRSQLCVNPMKLKLWMRQACIWLFFDDCFGPSEHLLSRRVTDWSTSAFAFTHSHTQTDGQRYTRVHHSNGIFGVLFIIANSMRERFIDALHFAWCARDKHNANRIHKEK